MTRGENFFLSPCLSLSPCLLTDEVLRASQFEDKQRRNRRPVEVMPEVYSLQSAENSNFAHDRRLPLAQDKNDQRTEVRYSPSDNNKARHADDFVAAPPVSNSSYRRPEFYYLTDDVAQAEPSTCRSPTELLASKRKPAIRQRESSWNKTEMYYISTADGKSSNANRQPPLVNNEHRALPSTAYLTPPESFYDKKPTVYLLTSSNENSVPLSFTRTPSPPVGERHWNGS